MFVHVMAKCYNYFVTKDKGGFNLEKKDNIHISRFYHGFFNASSGSI